MAETSVIGAGTVVSGHIRGEGSLEILGRVEGDVSVTGNVVIGAAGRVRGNVSGAELSIAGQVQGDLRGSQAVHLERGARVVGDISGPRVGIAPGALARGHVTTDGEPSQAVARPVLSATRFVPPPRALTSPIAAKSDVKAPPPAPALRAELRAPPPLVKAPPPPEPRRAEAQRAAPAESGFEPVRPIKAEPRRPPPPVVPVLSKGAKAKKKKSHD